MPKSAVSVTPGEIIIYSQADEPDFQIEVRVEEETVWLSQMQMADLFQATKQNISLHINNIYSEGELNHEGTVKEYLTVQLEGRRKVHRKLIFYNLDVIISVGYRVKSLRGTQFRIWANKILKEYMLQGLAYHRRISEIENRLDEHDKKFDLFINTNLPPKQGIFFDGQIFDAWIFASDLIRSANSSLILIDNYVNDLTLQLFSKRKAGAEAIIYTQTITPQLSTDLEKYNSQYPIIELKECHVSHDRFLIIDNQTVYHIGASLKDLGKKWFAFFKLNIDPDLLLQKLK
jgi:hypothetical protein